MNVVFARRGDIELIAFSREPSDDHDRLKAISKPRSYCCAQKL